MIGNSSPLSNRIEFHFLYEQPRTFLSHLMKNNCSAEQGVKSMTHTHTRTKRHEESVLTEAQGKHSTNS